VAQLTELGRGADSVAYLVDGEWVMRVPVTANAQRTLARELALLGGLAPALPLPIPAFERVGRRDGRLLFAGYRVLAGEPLTTEAHDGAFAALAAFLDALHAYPVGAARAAGVSEELTSGGYHPAQRELPGRLAGLLTTREVARLDALFERFERDHRPERIPAVLLHSDLKPEHVLRDPATGRLTGVLDWGDVAVGDGDFDLAVIGIFFGAAFLARLLEHLPRRDPELVREKGRFFTLLRAVQDLRYDAVHHPGATVASVATLRERLRAYSG
jgi:aminoglycoside 2''-phosphotransferase